MDIRLLLLFVLIVSVVAGCGGPDSGIGSEELVDFSYFTLSGEHVTAQLQKAMQQNSAIASRDDVADYIERMRADYYFLNYAYELGYNVDKSVCDEVERTARTIVTQANGLLFNEVVTQEITVTPEDIAQVYEKRGKNYVFEYVQFVHEGDLAACIGPTCDHISETAFTDFITADTPGKTFIHVEPTECCYPFWDIAAIEDRVLELGPGEVSEPLHTANSIYIVHMIDVSDRKQEPIETLYDTLQMLCQVDQRNRLTVAYNQSIHEAALTQIDHETADKLYAVFSSSDDTYQFTPSRYTDLYPATILTYQLNGDPVTLTVEDFIEHVNNRILRKNISTKVDFYHQLRECVFEPCAYQDAVERGITATDSFQKDKLLFSHRVMLASYNNSLMNELSVTREDIERYYQDNSDLFTQANIVTVTSVFCPTAEEIYAAYQIALQFPDTVDSTTIAEQLPSMGPQRIVKQSQELSISTADIPQKVKHQLQYMEPGDVTIPAQQDSIWCIFIKHDEASSRTIPLEAVREQIVAILTQQKLDELKAEMLPELKKKYDFIDTIDYDKYLSEEWIQSVLAENDAVSIN